MNLLDFSKISDRILKQIRVSMHEVKVKRFPIGSIVRITPFHKYIVLEHRFYGMVMTPIYDKHQRQFHVFMLPSDKLQIRKYGATYLYSAITVFEFSVNPFMPNDVKCELKHLKNNHSKNSKLHKKKLKLPRSKNKHNRHGNKYNRYGNKRR